MGDIALRGNKLTRKRFSRGGSSAPWLRGRSGPDNIKAPRGREGFKQMKEYEKKIGRLTVGKKSHIDTSAKQKLAAKHKKEEIKNKEAREEWAGVGKNLNKLTDWYKAEQKKYERAMWYFDDWYTEYTGGSWEENNIEEYKGG